MALCLVKHGDKFTFTLALSPYTGNLAFLCIDAHNLCSH